MITYISLLLYIIYSLVVLLYFNVRVLHTEWSDGFGGQERRVLAEINGLNERGHRCALACRRHSRIFAEASKLGINVYTLSMRHAFDLLSIWRLARILKKGGFNILNTHSGIDSWLGGFSSKIAQTPVLVRTRHLEYLIKRTPMNFIHYLPDMYLTCGDTMKNNLIENGGFPPDRVISIPTGIDKRFFHIQRNDELRKAYGLLPHHIVVANAAILRGSKGHEITLKAASIVLKTNPNVRFLIVGDGPKRKRLEATTVELGIADRVIFTGFIHDVSSVYSFTDIFVLSSWSEGLPQSLMQAMAARLPVVATMVGSVPEIVLHEKTALAASAGDYEIIAKHILRLIDDKELVNRLTENAFTLVSQKHTLEVMLDKIEELYHKLLKNKGI
ncbi:MAG: glycosyltransferase family 4 protein [Candidatus Magnetoovum sp. WYHC-5]|nr:glycosyltransferase family 4 protein [Candidatus Magnetoovum sp. WYHC-5]